MMQCQGGLRSVAFFPRRALSSEKEGHLLFCLRCWTSEAPNKRANNGQTIVRWCGNQIHTKLFSKGAWWWLELETIAISRCVKLTSRYSSLQCLDSINGNHFWDLLLHNCLPFCLFACLSLIGLTGWIQKQSFQKANLTLLPPHASSVHYSETFSWKDQFYSLSRASLLSTVSKFSGEDKKSKHDIWTWSDGSSRRRNGHKAWLVKADLLHQRLLLDAQCSMYVDVIPTG